MVLTLAWRNIWRNKRRTLITLSSIGFAVFFASILQSTQLGSYEKMIENAVGFYTGYIQIHKKGYWEEKSIDNSFIYTDSLQIKVNQTNEVLLSVPRIESFALAAYKNKTKGSLVLGIDPELENQLTRLGHKLIAGAYPQSRDANSLLISEGLAKYLKVGLKDTVVLIGQGFRGAMAAGKYPVTGILKFPTSEQNDQSIYITIPMARELYAAENRVNVVALGIDDPKNVTEVTQAIRSKVDTTNLEVMSWEEMLPSLVQSIQLDYRSGLIMLYVLYAVIGFGMFGTFLMMTAERQQEFGIMMAIGMHKERLQKILLIEIAILAALGVVAGILMSLPVIGYFYVNPIYFTGEMAKAFERFGIEPILPFSFDPRLFYNQGGVVLFMTILLSIYPVWIVKKLKVAEALRP